VKRVVAVAVVVVDRAWGVRGRQRGPRAPGSRRTAPAVRL
jgi:hypothetical protein